MKQKVFVEGTGGAEVTETKVQYRKDLHGKDVLYVTDEFYLSTTEKSGLAVQAEDGEIYIHILTDEFRKFGTEVVEPAAVTALRGAMSRIRKQGYAVYVYEGKDKHGKPVHYIFVASKSSVKSMQVAETKKLSLAIKDIKVPVLSVIFLNNFEGTLDELRALKSGIGLPVYEPREKGFTREDLIYDGALCREKLLPVVGLKKGRKGITTEEDEDLIKNTYKGLAILAASVLVGTLFVIMSVPYMKALPYMKPQEQSKADYLAVVNDYSQLFESVSPSAISPHLTTLSQQISKYGLEPLSYDISESSITAHIRTRNMKKALSFRKNFTGQCSDIQKEGPYFLFAVTVNIGGGK